MDNLLEVLFWTSTSLQEFISCKNFNIYNFIYKNILNLQLSH
ncbi:hypothetical protein MNB_SV-5-1007 [hydrothermal vent metagenome]|uniref:Uncharacterized protein n=1 Tax=hydrothermal vent metagenome TaxID=652676 RepID=A0A1W1EGC5_9ZZZZ